MSGCAPEIVEERFAPTASHAAYADALAKLDLHETSMGRAWIEAGRAAVEEPVSVSTPFREILYFDPRDPSAVGYAFEALRGHAVKVVFDTELDAYFADVYRYPNDGDPELVAGRPEEGNTIVFEPRRRGRYVLRLQPELLRGGRVTITVTAEASLSFPVQGAGPADVAGFYGDPRDGGARKHEGIDIFAPKGTPLLAASDSYVMRVGRRDRGGNVVVLHDRQRNLYLYYAHLDEHRAVQGDRVQAGDVIGTTGNTGNARTTPPHLHIGIYEGSWRRPVDPWDFFVSPETMTAQVALDRSALGTWRRISGNVEMAFAITREDRPRYANRNPLLTGAGDSLSGNAPLRREEGESSFPIPEPIPVPDGTAVRVLGAVGAFARIATPTGDVGFVDVATLSEDRTRLTLDRDANAVDPLSGDVAARLESGRAIDLIGSFGDARLAVLPAGRVVVVPN